MGCRTLAPLPWCDACAAQVDMGAGGPRCRRCGARPGTDGCVAPDVPSTLAAWDYRGVVARSIVGAKVRGGHAAWDAIARAGADRLVGPLERALAEVGAGAPVVVGVPADPLRRRRRGLDHTAVLADAVARRLGVPVATRWLSARPAPSRAAEGRRRPRGRPAGPPGPRRPRPPVGRSGAVRGLDVVLVDDVLTHGATLSGAAAPLRRNGARTVLGAVLARAHPGGSRPHVLDG